MSRKITAFYSSFHTANAAVREMVAYGLPRASISVAAKSASGAYGYSEGPMNTGLVLSTSLPDERRAGARIGAGIGMAYGLISGLMAGTGAWQITGFEPAVMGGLPALGLFLVISTGAGALIGSLAGRALGALIGLGIPEAEAEQYADSVRLSGVLVAVDAEAYNAALIREILERYRPSEVNDRSLEEAAPAWQKVRAGLQPVYAQEWERAQRR